MRRLCITLALLLLTCVAYADDLRLVLAVEPDSIDPHVHNFGGNKAFMPNLFETLTAIDANGRLTPNLATGWTLVDDTTWDISLRAGRQFSDGTKFTADDVAFTLNRVPAMPDHGRGLFRIREGNRQRGVVGPHHCA